MTTLHTRALKSRASRNPAPAVQMIAEPCCSVGEPLPCQGCVTADVFPADRLDPWDAEAPPELWPDSTDNFFWTTDDDDPEFATDGGQDHVLNTAADSWHAPFSLEAYEPTDEERREAAEAFGALESQAHLDRSDRLTPAELADHQADFYRSWGNPTGAMFANAMEALALKIRMTEATTPAELEARADALDLAARETWEAIGFEQGRRAPVDCYA